MKEIQGDIWEQKSDAICVTTNGCVKKCGLGVMGAGIAKQAALKYPDLPQILGDHLKTLGNHVNVLKFISHETTNECKCPRYTYIVAFPTKHNWWEDSDPALIEQSCQELAEMTTRAGWTTVSLPRPGCANGKLNWEDVKPICEKYFDDRFTIVDIKGA